MRGLYKCLKVPICSLQDGHGRTLELSVKGIKGAKILMSKDSQPTGLSFEILGPKSHRKQFPKHLFASIPALHNEVHHRLHHLRARCLRRGRARAWAAPAPEPDTIAERQSTASPLPSTMILLAIGPEGKTLGSINASGNFTREQTDFPFRVYATTGNDGNVYGSTGCALSPGPKAGSSKLDCQNGNQAQLGQFYDSNGLLALDGPTGSSFSIASWPAANDMTSVPLIIGGNGGYKKLTLQVKAASG